MMLIKSKSTNSLNSKATISLVNKLFNSSLSKNRPPLNNIAFTRLINKHTAFDSDFEELLKNISMKSKEYTSNIN